MVSSLILPSSQVARMERKGVTVTGAGEIQVGPPDGSVLLFR